MGMEGIDLAGKVRLCLKRLRMVGWCEAGSVSLDSARYHMARSGKVSQEGNGLVGFCPTRLAIVRQARSQLQV